MATTPEELPAEVAEDSETGSPSQANHRYPWRFWAIIISLGISSLLSALDVTVISTAMPSILKDLGSSEAYIWIANAYFLTMTAFQPLYGQTANIFGRRWLTLFAVAMFAVGSAVSGTATSLGALVAGRAIQGIGGGGINILIEIVVADLVPLRSRPKFISIIFIFYTVAVIIGPLIGGVFSQKVTWRWIFYLNLPISGTAFVLLFITLRVRYNKDTLHNSLKRVDYSGNLLLIASVVSVLLALTWGGVQYSWSSWHTILPLVMGLVGLIAFLALESTNWIAEHTMPIRLFTNRTSLGAFALTFVHSLLMYCLSYFLPVYFQAVLDTGPTRSGVNVIPICVVSMPFAMIAGWSVSKWGRYKAWFFTGTALLAIAFGLFTRLGKQSSTAYWAGVEAIAAAGLGILVTTTLPAIQAPLAETDQAVTTATWGFVRSFGGVWGVAIPAAAFNSRVNQLVSQISDPAIRSELANGGAYALASTGGQPATAGWDPALKAKVVGIYVESLKRCWQVALGFSLLAFVLCFVVKDVALRTDLETDFGLEREKQSGGEATSLPLKGNNMANQQSNSAYNQ